MNKFMVAVFTGMVSIASLGVQAATPEQECQKLQDDYNLIYASKGFCFKDPDAKKNMVMRTVIRQNQSFLTKSNNVLTLLKNVKKN